MSSNGAMVAAHAFVIRYSTIIFVRNLIDPQGGNPKERRAVVITPDVELAVGWPIIVVGVTATLPPQLTGDHVLLPFKNPPGTRHPKTGLTKRAAALCNWIVTVDLNDVTGKSGFVPPAHMAVIEQKAGAAAKTLGGWP